MLVLIKVNVLNYNIKLLGSQICTGSCGREFKLSQCPTSWPQRNKQTGESRIPFSGTAGCSSGITIVSLKVVICFLTLKRALLSSQIDIGRSRVPEPNS